MKRKLKLLKDLPSCPKGRIFKENVNGDYFHSMTDEERIYGNLKGYIFTKEEISENKEWFKAI